MNAYNIGETVGVDAKVVGVQVKGKRVYYNLQINGLKLQLPEDKVHALPPLDFPNDNVEG